MRHCCHKAKTKAMCCQRPGAVISVHCCQMLSEEQRYFYHKARAKAEARAKKAEEHKNIGDKAVAKFMNSKEFKNIIKEKQKIAVQKISEEGTRDQHTCGHLNTCHDSQHFRLVRG